MQAGRVLVDGGREAAGNRAGDHSGVMPAVLDEDPADLAAPEDRSREEEPGLRCELYAIVPMPPEPIDTGEDDEDSEDGREPWAASVPSSSYERAVAEAAFEDELDEDDLEDEIADALQAAADANGEDEADAGPPMAAVLLGQIVRFQKDRKHPDSLPLETIDILAKIVSGRVVEVVDKVLEDLLGE